MERTDFNLPHLQLQQVPVGQEALALYLPEPRAVERRYREKKQQDARTPFPYWAQVWPAARALGHSLLEHPQFVQDKTVLELAAGLALPSLVSARFARCVCCSDYLPEAVSVMQQTVDYHGLRHVHCRQLDWHHLPEDARAEVVLLSDINYDPKEFDVLFHVLTSFLKQGSTVLLSTPQRLMARPFIERLLPLCTYLEEIPVLHGNQRIRVSIYVMQ